MKKISKLIIIILCTFPTISFGQKEAANWYFGNAGIDFTCNPPNILLPSSKFYSIEGCSSISDSLGNLLFYTDGFKVFDRNHQLMQNGKDIGLDSTCWGSSTQSALIVKQPLQDSIYYIFTTDCAENYLANGFCFSIVNMKLNNGNGKVVLKKQKLLNKVCEKLAAVRQANGSDVWILVHEWGNDKFYSYSLTSAGLIITPIISITGRIQLPTDTMHAESASRGYMKFSPQGDKIVVLSTSDKHPFVSYPEIFSFNNTTGTVLYLYKINTQDSTNYYGGSFSPSGNLLYLSNAWYGLNLHQFNLSSNDSVTIANSKFIVYQDTSQQPTSSVGAVQIAPDGKIYTASRPNGLNVINNPNNYGSSCNFQFNSIVFSDSCQLMYCQYGLPNNDESIYLNSFNGGTCTPITIVDFSYQDSCANTLIQFTDSSNFYPYSINNWNWDFGDPLSGPSNFSKLKNPQHTYSNVGIFQVKLIAYSDKSYFCKVDSIIKSININCVTSIHEPDKLDNLLTISPNPFSNHATLSTKFPIQNGIFILKNTLGQILVQINSIYGQNFTIYRENLSNGLYTGQIIQDNKVIATKKIIISE